MQRGTLFLSFGQLCRLDETLGPLHCAQNAQACACRRRHALGISEDVVRVMSSMNQGNFFLYVRYTAMLCQWNEVLGHRL